MLFNFYRLCPNPKTLIKIIKKFKSYLSARVDSWSNTKTTLISFVEDYTI